MSKDFSPIYAFFFTRLRIGGGDNDPDGPGRWVPADAGDYGIQFIHREKLYRFAPKDQGRWIDISAVLAAIHKALDDAGVSERFVPHADSVEIGLFSSPRLRLSKMRPEKSICG